MIDIFLNAILSCFKHHMQLSYDLLYAIHMKVHNEQLIPRLERLENHVSSQVILELATKLVQSHKITHHLDQIRTDLATLYTSLHVNMAFDILYISALAWFSDIYPTQPLNYSVSIHMLILFLQIMRHCGKHETAYVECIIASHLISSMICSTRTSRVVLRVQF
jgi:hypothetical protein